jgi:hypothetical protein
MLPVETGGNWQNTSTRISPITLLEDLDISSHNLLKQGKGSEIELDHALLLTAYNKGAAPVLISNESIRIRCQCSPQERCIGMTGGGMRCASNKDKLDPFPAVYRYALHYG